MSYLCEAKKALQVNCSSIILVMIMIRVIFPVSKMPYSVKGDGGRCNNSQKLYSIIHYTT